MAEHDRDNRPTPHLEAAANRCLVALNGTAEALRALYLQPDRAVYLAQRSQIVLKAYADGAFLPREHDMTLAARGAGVLVPDVLGFERGDPAVLATRYVQGKPLSSAHQAAAREAGASLARFHRIGARPPFTTGRSAWDGHIIAWIDPEVVSLERRGILDRDQVARLRARFDKLTPRLASRPIALLHGDLQPAHILVDQRGARVAAFLDFADAQPGDPLLDIAVLTLWDKALTGPVLEGYAAIADDDETNELLAAYRLLRHLSSVPWLLDRGFAAYARRNIAAILAVLRSDEPAG